MSCAQRMVEMERTAKESDQPLLASSPSTTSSSKQQLKQRGKGGMKERAEMPIANSDSGIAIASDSLLSDGNGKPPSAEESASVDQDEKVMYGARHVILLFVPVSLCMILVVFTINTVGYYTASSGGVSVWWAPFTDKTDDSGTMALQTLGNALIFIGVVIFMTLMLILLYKFRLYKVIYGFLIISSLIVLLVISFLYLDVMIKSHNVPMDWATLAFVIWNWAAAGMLCLHWKGPIRLQQAYLLATSALMALVIIKFMPEWTLWTVLAVIAVWDIIAVLCPFGPLRYLVKTAQKRKEPIFPSLIYSSGVVYALVSMVDRAVSSIENATDENKAPKPEDAAGKKKKDAKKEEEEQAPEEDGNEEEERDVKLGLGDFIFYSVLVGKASSFGDWNTTVACFVGILIGLCCTLVLLAMFKKALPALPISIAFGLAFYFGTREVISPFTDALVARQLLF